MQLNTDLHHQYVLDRQQRLRAEAAAHRLLDSTPARTRIAQVLCRAADRLDLRFVRCRTRSALTERA
jgi:hypothetical protein